MSEKIFQRRSKLIWIFTLCAVAVVVLSAIYSGPVLADVACPYSKLLILLPGETHAPGSADGKTGTPEEQAVGVPFDVRVIACSNSWYKRSWIDHVMRVSSTDDTAELPDATPLVNGELSLTVTLNSAGSFTISVVDITDYEHISATSSVVTVASGAGELSGFEFSSISSKYAGQPARITVRAVDRAGNTVTDFSGEVELTEETSFQKGGINPDRVDFSCGQWSGDVTLFVADTGDNLCTGGNVTITATSVDDPCINGISNCFIVYPGELSRLQIIVPGETGLPGSETGIEGVPAVQTEGINFNVNIYATDEYWNKTRCDHNVRIISTDAEASTPVEDQLSYGHVTIAIAFGAAGLHTLTVSDITDPSIESMTSDTIAVIAGSPGFVIEPIDGPVTAGDSVDVEILVTDAGGERIEEYTGHALITADTGPGTLYPESIIFNEGIWRGAVVFRCAREDVNISCIDYSAPPNSGSSNSVDVLPAEYAGLRVVLPGRHPLGGIDPGIEGEPSVQTAGAEFAVDIQAVDCFWNITDSVSPAVSITSTDAFAEMPVETTLVNGVLGLGVRFLRAGTHSISVSPSDSSAVSSYTTCNFEVAAGAYSKLILLAPGEELICGSASGKAGSPLDQTINQGFSLDIYATDSWWNRVSGADDLVRLVCTDELATLPGDTPLDNGALELDVRLATGGYQKFDLTNISDPAIPGGSTQVRAINSGFHLEATVVPSAVEAGQEFTLGVRVTNDAGAVMQEVNSIATIQVLNSDTQGQGRGTLLNPQFQFHQGKRIVTQTYSAAERIVLVISDDEGSSSGTTNTITVRPGPPVGMKLESEQSWVGGRKSMLLSASVLDSYSNGVPDQPVKFSLVSGEGTITPIDSITGDNGVAMARFTGSYDPDTSRIKASSGSFTSELNMQTAFMDPDSPGGTVTNRPNPFHPDEGPTTITYKLSDDAAVTLKIFTLSGTPVLKRRIASGDPNGGAAGLNEVPWDGRNGKNEYVASGGYIVLIKAERAGGTLHTMRRRIAVVR